MNFNQNYYNQNNTMGMGYRPQNIPTPKMTQVLTQEQINELKKNAVSFSLNPDPKEVLRAKCTHRNNGDWALLENADGTMTCSICGKTFPMIEDVEQAAEITEAFVALLQSIKTYFLDMPETYVEDFFRIIPVVEKMPTLFEISQKNFYKYNSNNYDPLQQRGAYSFGMLDAIGSGFGYPQQQFNNGYTQGQFGGPAQFNQGFQQPQFNQGFQGQQQFNQGFQQPQFNQGFQGQQNTYVDAQGNPLTTDGTTAPGYSFNNQAQQQTVQAQDTVQTTKQFQK